MTRIRVWLWRLLAVVRRGSLEAILDEELRFHRESLVEDLRRSGLSETEAGRRARIQLGGPEQTKEKVRRGRGIPWIDSLRTDLRLGLRGLRREPLFASVVVLTLALGIGANAAIFSLLHGVLVRPLPYPEPDRLVRVFETNTSEPAFPVSPLNLVDYQREEQSFDGLAAYTRKDLELSGAGDPRRLAALRVTPNYFEVLGVRPLMGNVFDDSATHDAARVLIISESLWRACFAADPDIVGRQVWVDGSAWNIAAVMPSGFQHVGGRYRSTGDGETVDAWWPVELNPEKVRRFWHYLNVVGRLAPGFTLESAEQDLMRVAADLETRYPDSNRGWRVRLMPLQERMVGDRAEMLGVLMGAVGFVLLIACANIAHLLLGRSLARQREFAISAALGAGRARLAQRVFVESALLAALGGLVGVLVGWMGLEVLKTLMPNDFPRLGDIRVDASVLLFAAALTALTTIVFGSVPAARIRPETLSVSLASSGRGSSAGRSAGQLRGAVIVAEVALASALLVGAGLLLRSFVSVHQTDWGFNPGSVVTFSVSLPPTRYADDAAVVGFYDRLGESLAALPGVTAAGGASYLPWSGWDENTGFGIVDDSIDRERSPNARYGVVQPGYFEVLDVELVAGRRPTHHDDERASPVVTVNRQLIERYFPGSAATSVVGRRLDLWGREVEIVGVVDGVVDNPAERSAVPALFWHFAQNPSRDQAMVIKVVETMTPMALASALRSAVGKLDPQLPVDGLRPLTETASAALAERRFVLSLVGAFAALSVLLAAVGIYGLLAYSVRTRRRELGIRIALGAGPRRISRLVLLQGMRWLGLGLALGLALALLLGRLLENLLFGVKPIDATTYGIAAVTVVAVGAVASGLPAFRAGRTDPLPVLRED